MNDISKRLRELADQIEGEKDETVAPTLEGIAKALEELLKRPVVAPYVVPAPTWQPSPGWQPTWPGWYTWETHT